CRSGMGHKGFPAHMSLEIVDTLIMARELGDLVAHLCDHALFALRCASPPTHVLGPALRLLDIGDLKEVLDAVRREDLADGLAQLRGLRDLALPSAAGRRERANLHLGLSQAVLQRLALTRALGRGGHYQNPFWPLAMRLGFLDPTGALAFVALSHQDCLTLGIGSEHALKFTGPVFGDPWADPLGHLLGRRTGQGERREGQWLPTTEVGADVQRTPLAVAADAPSRLLEPLAQTLKKRDV